MRYQQCDQFNHKVKVKRRVVICLRYFSVTKNRVTEDNLEKLGIKLYMLGNLFWVVSVLM